jgi:PST family polysaccharide transporter
VLDSFVQTWARLYGSKTGKNVLALYVLKIGTYVVPLITLPWLTRRLGPTHYGELQFALGIVMYCKIIAEYGFSLSATREIAVAPNRFSRSSIFWSTTMAQCLLAIVCLGIAFLVVSSVPSIASYATLVSIGSLLVVGTALTPVWYFQGIEQLWLVSAITMASSFLTVPLTIIFIRGPQDVDLAMAIMTGAPAMAGIVCQIVLHGRREIDFMAFRLQGVVEALQNGWHTFISTASVSLYTVSNVVLLGLVSGSAAVGFYSPAESVVRASQGMFAPISQAVYPRICGLTVNDPAKALSLMRRSLKVQGGVAFFLSVVLFIFSGPIVRIAFGPGYEKTVSVLYVMAVVPFLVGLSNSFGVLMMLPLGMKRAFSAILVISGIFNVLVLPLLAWGMASLGAAVAVVLTELFVTCAMYFVLVDRGIKVLSLRREVS